MQQSQVPVNYQSTSNNTSNEQPYQIILGQLNEFITSTNIRPTLFAASNNLLASDEQYASMVAVIRNSLASADTTLPIRVVFALTDGTVVFDSKLPDTAAPSASNTRQNALEARIAPNRNTQFSVIAAGLAPIPTNGISEVRTVVGNVNREVSIATLLNCDNIVNTGTLIVIADLNL